MGDKYIKKGEDGKDYLYEDLGLTGAFFGDRKIGEVKESSFVEKCCGAPDEYVKSDSILSHETYSVDRDENPIAGLWGAPEYTHVEVTDDRSGETSDYDYEWRIDGERYSEHKRETTNSDSSSSSTNNQTSPSSGLSGSGSSDYSHSNSSSSSVGAMWVIGILGIIMLLAIFTSINNNHLTSQIIQTQRSEESTTAPLTQEENINTETQKGNKLLYEGRQLTESDAENYPLPDDIQNYSGFVDHLTIYGEGLLDVKVDGYLPDNVSIMVFGLRESGIWEQYRVRSVAVDDRYEICWYHIKLDMQRHPYILRTVVAWR